MSSAFLIGRAALQQRVTELGVVQSLGQVVLRTSCPGMPDTYQGTEFWDLSLVDPDNRRPVDYEARASSLANLESLLTKPTPSAVRALLDDWRSATVKQYVLASLLCDRRVHPALYAIGTYEPLEVRGARSDCVIAFARHHESSSRIVAVTRLAARLTRGLWAPEWDDTALVVPAWCRGSHRDLLSGGEHKLENVLPFSRLLDTLPVAVLAAD